MWPSTFSPNNKEKTVLGGMTTVLMEPNGSLSSFLIPSYALDTSHSISSSTMLYTVFHLCLYSYIAPHALLKLLTFWDPCSVSFSFFKKSVMLYKYVFVIMPSVGYGDAFSSSTVDNQLVQRNLVYASWELHHGSECMIFASYREFNSENPKRV